jgi:histidyl-tRNA synthetase
MLVYLFGEGVLVPKRRSPCQVMVLLPDESKRPQCRAIAEQLRGRGIQTEVHHRKASWGKQMKRASQLGIRYAWFPGSDEKAHQIKDLETGEQSEVTLEAWRPAADAHKLKLDLAGETIYFG